ncbi:YqgE/AlgH family protein [Myroides pelagicus]|uniref:YqgE/AlgH family protein n=1 Tax=Myroides pelagicus TaxID=270914 RepID=UPI002DBE3CD7|nr:YqgE/AlgH family protein [Myroides pelagicus]MEC4115136.1 YqgE/AlgH family protein [Myroides pelagicus]
MSNYTRINKGNLLLATPSSNPLDLQFSRSTILIAEHNLEGTIGFILNKPLDLTLNQLIPTTTSSLSIFEGGPVESDKLFCIHNRPDLINNSIHIIDDLYWGGDYNQVFALLEENLLTKQNIRFILGYTGWEFQQLEDELENDYWIIAKDIKVPELISTLSSSKYYWKNCLAKQGKQYELWVNTPENPNLN